MVNGTVMPIHSVKLILYSASAVPPYTFISEPNKFEIVYSDTEDGQIPLITTAETIEEQGGP